MDLFWRDIGRSSNNGPLVGDIDGGFEGFGDPKVDDLCEVFSAFLDQEDVGGLEIAVDQTFFMDDLHRFADLQKDLSCPQQRRTARMLSKAFFESDAFQKLHNVVSDTLFKTVSIMDVNDVFCFLADEVRHFNFA